MEKWRETTILNLNAELENQININMTKREFKICKFQTWFKVWDEHSGNEGQRAMAETNQYHINRDEEATMRWRSGGEWQSGNDVVEDRNRVWTKRERD